MHLNPAIVPLNGFATLFKILAANCIQVAVTYENDLKRSRNSRKVSSLPCVIDPVCANFFPLPLSSISTLEK